MFNLFWVVLGTVAEDPEGPDWPWHLCPVLLWTEDYGEEPWNWEKILWSKWFLTHFSFRLFHWKQRENTKFCSGTLNSLLSDKAASGKIPSLYWEPIKRCFNWIFQLILCAGEEKQHREHLCGDDGQCRLTLHLWRLLKSSSCAGLYVITIILQKKKKGMGKCLGLRKAVE